MRLLGTNFTRLFSLLLALLISLWLTFPSEAYAISQCKDDDQKCIDDNNSELNEMSEQAKRGKCINKDGTTDAECQEIVQECAEQYPNNKDVDKRIQCEAKAKCNEDFGCVIKEFLINLLSINCATNAFANFLIKTEYQHTCIPEEFNILSSLFTVFEIFKGNGLGWLYIPTLLRLKMHDETLLPGNCDNLADPSDPKISFALCSNFKLMANRALMMVLFPSIIIEVNVRALQGENVWDAFIATLQRRFINQQFAYHEFYYDKKIGESGVFLDFPSFAIDVYTPWNVKQKDDKVCFNLADEGLDPIAIGCKYITEPCPNSIYGDFFNINESQEGNDSPCVSAAITSNLTYKSQKHYIGCANLGKCYSESWNNSKTLIPLSGPIVSCITRAIGGILLSPSLCKASSSEYNLSTTMGSGDSILLTFSRSMTLMVKALLVLYLAFTCVSVILNPSKISTGPMLMKIIKIILVAYFSIGLGSDQPKINTKNNTISTGNGMADIVFPLMFDLANFFTSIALSGTSNGMCKFDLHDYDKDQSLMLWDILDCRLANYLGIDIINDFKYMTEGGSGGFSIPPYFWLIPIALLLASWPLAFLAIAYPVMVISISIYLAHSFIVSILFIALLGTMAPIFIPLSLFEKTKGYFDSWLKMVISFVLQPMVAAVFLAFVYSITDFGIYRTCKFKAVDVHYPFGTKKHFVLDTNINSYIEPDDEIGLEPKSLIDCKKSIGYWLYIIIGFDTDQPVIELKIDQKEVAKLTVDQKKALGIKSKETTFFSLPTIDIDYLRDLVGGFLMSIFMLYIAYNFSAELGKFAAEMTGGASLAKALISPTEVIDKAKEVMLKRYAAGAGGKKGEENAEKEDDDKESVKDKTEDDKESVKGKITNNESSKDQQLDNKQDNKQEGDKEFSKSTEEKKDSTAKDEASSNAKESENSNSKIAEDKNSSESKED